MTTPSTPTSTMKEAERLWELIADRDTAHRALERRRATGELMNADFIDAVDAASEAIDAFIRSLVEAQPSAVAGEATSSIDHAQRVGHLPGPDHWQEVCRTYRCRHNSYDMEQVSKLRTYIEMGVLIAIPAHRAAPSAVLPLKGEVPKCPNCNGTGRVPSEDPHTAANAQFDRRCDDCSGTGKAAGEGAAAPSDMDYGNNMNIEVAAPVETEQPVAWMHHCTAPGNCDIAAVNGVIHDEVKRLWLEVKPKHVEHYTVPLYARPLPGGVPTGLSDEQIEAMICACVPGGDTCDPQHIADAIRAHFHRAALSAGAPSSLQGERK